jgi:hypothetical protein
MAASCATWATPAAIKYVSAGPLKGLGYTNGRFAPGRWGPPRWGGPHPGPQTSPRGLGYPKGRFAPWRWGPPQVVRGPNLTLNPPRQGTWAPERAKAKAKRKRKRKRRHQPAKTPASEDTSERRRASEDVRAKTYVTFCRPPRSQDSAPMPYRTAAQVKVCTRHPCAH